MKVSEICTRPTTLVVDGDGYHESILRSYAIVEKVRELLVADTPPSVVLELLDEMAQAPQTDLEKWRFMRKGPGPPDYLPEQ